MKPARFEHFCQGHRGRDQPAANGGNCGQSWHGGGTRRVERKVTSLVDAIIEGADTLPLNAKLKELVNRHRTLTRVSWGSAASQSSIVATCGSSIDGMRTLVL